MSKSLGQHQSREVKTFAYRYEADFAQTELEARDISSFIKGDDASGWAPHIGLGTGGMPLVVEQGDYDRARQLLNEEGFL